MLTEICAEVNNYFVSSDEDKKKGSFEISDGVLKPSFDLKFGQYYRVIGSVFNDGVHCFGKDMLKDEKFTGAVWKMRVPEDFLKLCGSIAEYKEKYGTASPYTSESFAGYSYTKAAGKNGTGATWKDAFASDLNRYRRLKYGTDR